MINFLGQEIEVGKLYVYLKNHGTGSSTTRKLKMIGRCTSACKQIQFERMYAEGYRHLESGEDTLRSPSDVICEYTPAESEWVTLHSGLTETHDGIKNASKEKQILCKEIDSLKRLLKEAEVRAEKAEEKVSSLLTILHGECFACANRNDKYDSVACLTCKFSGRTGATDDNYKL